jgi:hypothetical protein
MEEIRRLGVRFCGLRKTTEVGAESVCMRCGRGIVEPPLRNSYRFREKIQLVIFYALTKICKNLALKNEK